MTSASIVLAAIRSRGGRTCLLIVSVTVAFLLFGALVALDQALATPPAQKVDRLVVSDRTSFTRPLPLTYVERVARVPGVAGISHQSWFGGYVHAPHNVLIAYAVDVPTFLALHPDRIVLTDQEVREFQHDRAGVIIGKSVAERFGWRLGDRIALGSSIFRRRDGNDQWEFNVRGVYSGAEPSDAANGLYFHYGHLNEARTFGRNTVGSIVVVPGAGHDRSDLGRAIDAEFAFSSSETVTQDEHAFARMLIAQFGDVRFAIRAVLLAGFIALLMITSSTLTLSVLERRRDLAVLKTIGFGRARILALVLAEPVGVCVIGAVFGIVLAAGLLTLVSAGMEASFGPIGVTAGLTLQTLAFACVFGFIAGMAPGYLAWRIPVGQALAKH